MGDSRRVAPYLVLSLVLGLAGAVVLSLVGHSGAPRDPHLYWWWIPPLSAVHIGQGHAMIIARCSLVALVLAWLAAGVAVRRRPELSWSLWGLGLPWAVPLLISQPTFSGDVYSYAATGAQQTHGFNPYTTGPDVLGPASHYASAVTPAWYHTGSPYGPGFLMLTHLVVALCGGHAVLAAAVLRLLSYAAMVGVVVIALRLAHRERVLREDGPILWLLLLNPLVLISVASGGHNDVFMIAGVTGAVVAYREGKVRLALLLVSAAALIKIVALAVALVLIAHHAWQADSTRERRRRFAEEAALAGGGFAVMCTLVGLTMWQGLGAGWGFLHTLSVPGHAVTTITPVDALWDLVRPGSVIDTRPGDPFNHANGDHLLGLMRGGATLLGVGLLVLIAWRVRTLGVERAAVLALLAVALVNTVVFPWYLLWSLPLVAVGGFRRERALLGTLSVLLLFVEGTGGKTTWGAWTGWPGRHPAEIVTLLVVAGGCAWLRWGSEGLDRVAERVPTRRAEREPVSV